MKFPYRLKECMRADRIINQHIHGELKTYNINTRKKSTGENEKQPLQMVGTEKLPN